MAYKDKEKKCSKCGEKFPNTLTYFYAHNQKKDGLRPDCKNCCLKNQQKYRKNNSNKIRKQQQEYYKNHSDNFKNNRLRYKYNLTLKQHKQMYFEQNGCCVICGQPVPYDEISTDHNHTTNKVRDLLCHRCNILVGIIENNFILINPTIKYLKKHNSIRK